VTGLELQLVPQTHRFAAQAGLGLLEGGRHLLEALGDGPQPLGRRTQSARGAEHRAADLSRTCDLRSRRDGLRDRRAPVGSSGGRGRVDAALRRQRRRIDGLESSQKCRSSARSASTDAALIAELAVMVVEAQDVARSGAAPPLDRSAPVPALRPGVPSHPTASSHPTARHPDLHLAHRHGRRRPRTRRTARSHSRRRPLDPRWVTARWSRPGTRSSDAGLRSASRKPAGRPIVTRKMTTFVRTREGRASSRARAPRSGVPPLGQAPRVVVIASRSSCRPGRRAGR
jgi:hypothetical protein